MSFFPAEPNTNGEGQTTPYVVQGTDNNDLLQDGQLWNHVLAGDGNDGILVYPTYFFVETHIDLFNGGAGIDTVSYIGLVGGLDNVGAYVPGSAQGVNVNLDQQSAYRKWGAELIQRDTLLNIENVVGSKYADTIRGDSIANQLWGHDGNDELFGLNGNDTIWGSIGHDSIDGGSGNDLLSGEDGYDSLNGGSGNDSLYGGNQSDSLNGGSGNDFIDGGSHNDTIDGGWDNDLMKGGDGNDSIQGGLGNDTLGGGAGNDTLNGGSGVDTAEYDTTGAVQVNLWFGTSSGALGNDTLSLIENVKTGSGNDVVLGNDGKNRLETGNGHDTVYAFNDHDTVVTGSGNDVAYGYEGNDSLYGGSGNDRLYGDAGNDFVDGEAGNDTLSGGDGADWLSGGYNGNDVLRGGEGADTLSGGTGADVIQWRAGDLGIDQIFGFDITQDRLSFTDNFFGANVPPGGDASDVLLVANVPGGSSLLAANTGEAGWQWIAQFNGVSLFQLQGAINSGSIFNSTVGPVGDGGPGGLLG
jgi:Ca2+-binding RTX toxin-like protein